MLADDKRALAYHEAGHAVAARYLQPENRVLKASIIRAGDALGVVQRTEREERHTLHARQIEVDIMISLGSRAVEEVILETKMSGAGSDLMNATNRAVAYCSYLGMGSSLLVFPATAAGGVPGPIARMADSLLQNLMEETKRLVREKEYAIHAVAAALLEHGELIGQELEERVPPGRSRARRAGRTVRAQDHHPAQAVRGPSAGLGHVQPGSGARAGRGDASAERSAHLARPVLAGTSPPPGSSGRDA